MLVPRKKILRFAQDDTRHTVPTPHWNTQKSRGLPDTALTKGNTARVVGYPHREKSDELRAERIIIDGKTVELR